MALLPAFFLGAVPWLRLTFRPATTRLALRVAPVLAEKAIVAVPLPVPAPLTDAQAAFDEEDHVE